MKQELAETPQGGQITTCQQGKMLHMACTGNGQQSKWYPLDLQILHADKMKVYLDLELVVA